MNHELATDDPKAQFSHVAFTWDTELKGWVFLCAGRTPEEFQNRRQDWISKGVSESSIKQYSCNPAPERTQPVRAAQNRITTENTRNPPQDHTQQPTPISDELWAVIRERRPRAYTTLQKYGVKHAIITVGTSRTKLEFPDLPDVVRGEQEWQEFDTHTVHVIRPIIVLDGIPERGFKPISWLNERERNSRS